MTTRAPFGFGFGFGLGLTARRAAALAVTCTAMMAVPAPARAHHPTVPTGRALQTWSGRPAAWLRLGGLGTGLNGGGSLYSLELDGQIGFAERFAARLRAPFHMLRRHGDEEMGPGDLTLGGEGFLALGRLRLGLGADLELPTGDADAGLGHGAVTLTPAVTAQVRIGGGVSALAQSSLLVDLSQQASGALDPVEQQDEVELRAAAGAVWERGPLAATGVVRLSMPLAADDQPDAFATGQLIVELALSSRLRGSLLAEAPLASDQRFDWRAGLALGYVFSDPD